MKFLLMTSLVVLSLSSLAFAQDDNQFAEQKKQIIKELDKRLTILNNHKACVAAVTSFTGVKKCDDADRAENDKLRVDSEKQRAIENKAQLQKINENIKKLEESKKDLSKDPNGNQDKKPKQ